METSSEQKQTWWQRSAARRRRWIIASGPSLRWERCILFFFLMSVCFNLNLENFVSSKSKKQSKETKSHGNEVRDPINLHEFNKSPLWSFCLPLLSPVFTSFFPCQLVVLLRSRSMFAPDAHYRTQLTQTPKRRAGNINPSCPPQCCSVLKAHSGRNKNQPLEQ